jgi:pSer/pThr/pTyr-binding forkhead associated (FHA) protein
MIFEIFGPLTNVGRGSHNDVVVNDESLSASHAKIFRRDGLWWLMDQASTSAGDDEVKGTRAIAALHVDAARKLSEQQRAASAAAAAPGDTKATPVEQKKGCASMVAFIISLAAIGATAAITLIWSRG